MKYLYKNKHWAPNKEYNIDKLLYLTIDRPDIINGYFDFIWQNNKRQYHRDYDLPSNIDFFIDEDTDDEDICYLYWCKYNKEYRYQEEL